MSTPADDSIILTWRGTTARRFPAPTWFCYLLHFEHRYYHAGHYIGFSGCVDARLKLHRAGGGARLLEVVTDAGIDFEVARLWPCDSYEQARTLERKLKRTHGHGPALCPVCRGTPMDPYAAMRLGHWPLTLHDRHGTRKRRADAGYFF